MTENLKKGQRLKLFYQELEKQPPPHSLEESRALMAKVMKSTESKYAPEDPDPMTIPELSHWTVAEYGQGGAYIPLINGQVHINANGAAGFYDSYKSHYAFTMPSIGGVDFVPESNYTYSWSDAQIRQRTKKVTVPAEVAEIAPLTTVAENPEPASRKIGWWDRIASFFKRSSRSRE
ncbi:hypothetical protein [Pseudomonas cichorii]|uniref:hypothetical protein n=1 Tax=Pseudomonas cichorii TaxID=36746 RepID=UPI001C8903B5|nr:hypothetical protein [Pseudomonas cichorii]MBX8493279.1 hypothetical protein [Pseudomonas cichorii]MBX8530599.1 hypothetical protein [Pseudomonas cichorii]